MSKLGPCCEHDKSSAIRTPE